MQSTKKIIKSHRTGIKFPPINELEPISTREATKRATEILDATYEKADLAAVVNDNCGHLTALQQSQLLALLHKYEELFDGTLGDFKTEPVRFHLKKMKSHIMANRSQSLIVEWPCLEKRSRDCVKLGFSSVSLSLNGGHRPS